MTEECPICLETFDKESDLLLFTTRCCNKKFHHNCFVECMKIKQECPLCRNPQSEFIIINIEPNNRNEIQYRINILYCALSSILIFIVFIRFN